MEGIEGTNRRQDERERWKQGQRTLKAMFKK